MANWTNLSANLKDEEDHAQCSFSKINNFQRAAILPISILGLWCVLSNGAVIGTVLKDWRQTRQGLFILCSLSLTDFLWGGLFTPIYITHIIKRLLTEDSCVDYKAEEKGFLSVSVVCTLATLGNVAVLSIDRYLAVTKLTSYKVLMSRRRAFAACLCAWLIPISTGTLTVLGIISLNITIAIMACYIVPNAVFIIVFQLLTFRGLRRHNNTVAHVTAGTNQVNPAHSANAIIERKLAVTTSYIVLVMGLVYIPMACVRVLVSQFGGGHYARTVFVLMSALCASVNPVLYYRGNSQIREGVYKLFKCQ